MKIQSLDEEINYINYLIKITEQKLLTYENCGNNFNNKKKFLTLTFKDIMELIDKAHNNGKIGLISAKSDDKLNVEYVQSNNKKQNINQKKSVDIQKKLQYNDDYSNLCEYSNKLSITSKNNKPIVLEKLDLKSDKINENENEKDELIYLKPNHNKDNNNINNESINNENNEVRNEIIINSLKNFHTENKIGKDSVISDFSYYGNNNSNIFIDQSLFSNNNYYFMCLNKSENEIF